MNIETLMACMCEMHDDARTRCTLVHVTVGRGYPTSAVVVVCLGRVGRAHGSCACSKSIC
eukprot:1144066-Pelagomonas_calceolata.AAC.3